MPTAEVLSKRLNSHGAYSLLELVVVLVLIAVCTAIAFPAFNQAIDRHNVDQATTRLLADLQFAKRRAELSSSAVYVDFNAANNTVAVRDVNDFERKSSQHSVTLSQPPYRTQIVTIQLGGISSVKFNGFGVAETLGSVQLKSGKSYSKVVINADSFDTSKNPPAGS